MRSQVKTNLRKCGFGKQVESVNEGKCPMCSALIDKANGFRDSISRREFKISGLCQICQDKMFGGE